MFISVYLVRESLTKKKKPLHQGSGGEAVLRGGCCGASRHETAEFVDGGEVVVFVDDDQRNVARIEDVFSEDEAKSLAQLIQRFVTLFHLVVGEQRDVEHLTHRAMLEGDDLFLAKFAELCVEFDSIFLAEGFFERYAHESLLVTMSREYENEVSRFHWVTPISVTWVDSGRDGLRDLEEAGDRRRVLDVPDEQLARHLAEDGSSFDFAPAVVSQGELQGVHADTEDEFVPGAQKGLAEADLLGLGDVLREGDLDERSSILASEDSFGLRGFRHGMLLREIF